MVACKILIGREPEIARAVEHQEDVDAVRDLFVRIDELSIGPDGPRVSSTARVPPSRLEKRLGFSRRAQAMWPNCPAVLASRLDSEYLSVKNELADADREADIEAYLEAQRPDDDE